jgi:hypothetical protein
VLGFPVTATVFPALQQPRTAKFAQKGVGRYFPWNVELSLGLNVSINIPKTFFLEASAKIDAPQNRAHFATRAPRFHRGGAAQD